MLYNIVPNVVGKTAFRPIIQWIIAWAPAEIFPEGGKITDTLKSRHVFGAPKAQTEILPFFRDVLD